MAELIWISICPLILRNNTKGTAWFSVALR
jgi:hypothetical protein